MKQNVTEYDLVIRGHAVLSDRIVYHASIAVKDGKIAGIFEDGHAIAGQRNVDAAGCFVLPGAIDAHVHCFSSLEEGFQNAGNAAAAGGVTTIIEMPYDATGIVCTEKMLLDKIERANAESVVDTALLATIPKDGSLEEIPKLAEAGACGFKVSMFNTDSFRFPRIDDGRLHEAFTIIEQTGCPVGVHAENDEIVRMFIRKFASQGQADPRAHCWSRPKVAESAAAIVAMELAYDTGVKLHLYHSTFQRVFELADYYRAHGARITAETCTHYLVFDEEQMRTLGAKGKINPPLRSRQDVEDLWAIIGRGSVDMITSDHAPWLLERKMNPDIFQNSSGAPGVENLLPVIYSEGVAQGRMTLLELVRLLSENPARTFGLDDCKGSIAVGKDADLVILDPNQTWRLDERELHSSAGWSPYHDLPMQGKIMKTFVRGKEVYNGQVIGQPGDGRFIKAHHKER